MWLKFSFDSAVTSVVSNNFLHATHTQRVVGCKYFVYEPACDVRYIPCSISRASDRTELRGFPLLSEVFHFTPLTLLFHHFSVSQPSVSQSTPCAFKCVHVMHVQSFYVKKNLQMSYRESSHVEHNWHRAVLPPHPLSEKTKSCREQSFNDVQRTIKYRISNRKLTHRRRFWCWVIWLLALSVKIQDTKTSSVTQQTAQQLENINCNWFLSN